MRRLIYTGAIALLASAVFTGSASADTRAVDFGFRYDSGSCRGCFPASDPSYGETVVARVRSTHVGDNGGTATDVYIVYGTVGTDAAAFVDYPIAGGVPNTATAPSR